MNIPSNRLLCDTYKCGKVNTYREFRASLKHFRARMDPILVNNQRGVGTNTLSERTEQANEKEIYGY